MYRNVELWIEIRRRVLNGEISKRQACHEYQLHWQTLKKILSQPVPPGHRASGPPRPSKLDPFRPVVEWSSKTRRTESITTDTSQPHHGLDFGDCSGVPGWW